MSWRQKFFLSVFGNSARNPANSDENNGNWNFCLPAVAIELVIGLQNKLVEVLVHVLGKKNVFTVLGNLAVKASNFQP